MLHTFVALVDDKPGVLTRVASLFRRLSINIVSLTVGESEHPDTSRMTIVCEAPEHAADRIRASLYKLEITRDVDEVGRSEAVIRELCLIKVAAGPNEPNGLHSEEKINDYIENSGIDPDSVTRIYSERVPCSTPGHNCAVSLNAYPNARLSWSLSGSSRENFAALARFMAGW